MRRLFTGCILALSFVACDGPAPTGDGGPPLAMCAGGPLAAPIPNCMPTARASTGDPQQDCVDRINQFRAECQCLPPLERWTEAESCANQQARFDAEGGGPHGGFSGNICSPRGNGQNECPGWPSQDAVINNCLQQMWDEGPGEPFSEHGHYINMSNPRFSRVACGFFDHSSGLWAVQNFE